MKKLFPTLFFFLLASKALSQDNKKENITYDKVEISYDARKGLASIYPPYEVSQNGYIIFEITDINLFRYSITLTELQNNVINSTKLSEGNTQVSIDPALFNLTDLNLNIQVIPVATNAETKALADLEKDKSDKETEIERKLNEIQNQESEYLAALSRIEAVSEIDKKQLKINSELSYLNSIAASDRTKEQKDKLTLLNKENSQLTTERQILNLEYKIDDDKNFISSYISTTKNQLESELNTLKDQLVTIEHNYKKKVLDDSSDNTRIKNFNSAMEAYSTGLRKLNELTDFYQRLVSLLYSDDSFDEIRKEKFKVAYDVIKVEKATKDDILKHAYLRLRDIEKKYLEFSKAYSLVSSSSTISAEKKNDAKEIFDKISAFSDQIKTNSYHSFFMQLAKVYDAINESNFTLKYQTLILSDNADLINFNLNAQPNSNLPGSVETKPLNFKYDVKIKGGVKIDVSTGIFWNIGLYDKSYRFESQSDTSTLVIKEDNESLFIPSFGVLFNLYKRSTKDVKFGGNIGFSTNADRLNYYLGGSVLIGKSERMNINFGIAGAQVDRVSDLYHTDDPIQVTIADLPNEVPLRNPSPFKVGAFFGITFNLTGTKNKETLSQISAL